MQTKPDRTCQICGRHESMNPDLKFVPSPPMRALANHRVDICETCADDLLNAGVPSR